MCTRKYNNAAPMTNPTANAANGSKSENNGALHAPISVINDDGDGSVASVPNIFF